MSGPYRRDAADVLGGIEERRQQADGIQDLEGAGLDRRGARLAVRPHLPLDEPRVHAVAGELGGGEQPGRAGADDQDVVSRHSITPGEAGNLGSESSKSPTRPPSSAAPRLVLRCHFDVG